MRATTAPSRARSSARPSSRSARPISCCCSSTRRPRPARPTWSWRERLRRSRVPVLLVANKLDNPARHDEALEYHELGLGDPFALSALHGIATGDLLDEIVARLRALGRARASSARPTRSASSILGRPNVGKSSLLNALCDEERTIVSEIPGTTRDSIDIRLERERPRLPADRHRRPAPPSRAAPAGRVLERGALARGRAPGRRRARPDRLHRGHHGAGSARGRRRAPRELRHHLRALQVGHRAARARGRARAAAHQGPSAAADRRHLGAHQARPRAALCA